MRRPGPAAMRRVVRRLRSGAGAEAGSVSVEFVIVFPALVMMLALIAFVSLLIAAQSEVQQVAFELARKGFALVSQNYDGDLCLKLGQDYLPALAGNSVTLQASKFAVMGSCPGQPAASGMLTISVTYDLTGGAAAQFSQMLGVNLGQITRSASVLVK